MSSATNASQALRPGSGQGLRLDSAQALGSLGQLTLVRIREFTREPEAVFWAIFFPILLTSALGIAFSGGSGQVLAVVTSSAELARALDGEPGLDVAQLDAAAAADALRTGKAVLFAAREADGKVVYRFDDTNPEGRAARMLVDQAVQRAAGRVDPAPSRDDLVREPGSRYVDFVVPGLVGLGIMSNALWGLGFSIVDSRRRHLMKRLVATPMSRTHYLLSFLFWRMMLLVVEVGVPIGFGVLAFGVPVRGRLFDLVIVCVVASLSFSALGLLLASRPRTIEAVSGLMNLVQVPMWILSGVFFSAQRFPDAVQPLIRALPLTAVIDALRAHMLQGATLVQLAPQLATLSGWLVVSFVLALKLFRWR
jgi:ABC-type multidrug transport system permease subunit